MILSARLKENRLTLKVNKRLQGCICCNAVAQLKAPLSLHCSSMLASAAVALHLLRAVRCGFARS